jgi:hypothetical protein
LLLLAVFATLCGDCNVRHLLVVNTATALSVATAQVPQMHNTLVVVNSSLYGGSGAADPMSGSVARFGYKEPSLRQVAQRSGATSDPGSLWSASSPLATDLSDPDRTFS